MSTHCFICGGPDNWIGSKEIEHDEMIDVKAFPEYEKKKNLYQKQYTEQKRKQWKTKTIMHQHTNEQE